jgi:endonuclease G
MGQIRPVDTPAGYRHDRFATQPRDIVREYGGFITSFDSDDDDNGDGAGDRDGIPEWVAHEVRRYTEGDCIPTGARPSKWFTDLALFHDGIAPDDASYRVSRDWRNRHPNWYVRGHLAMKLIVERLGEDAAWNTHTVLNAVPQRSKFNSNIWLDLELLTGAWAQRYGAVWIVTGPVVIDRKPSGNIGDEGEFHVVIPDALFKIVARDVDGRDWPDVIAFIYPQLGPGFDSKRGAFPHHYYLTSVDNIEALTGLDFFTALDEAVQKEFEPLKATALWPVDETDFLDACRGR